MPLKYSQKQLLYCIQDHPLSTTATLGKLLGRKPRTMQSSLKILRKQGYVEPVPNPDDLHKTMHRITPAGVAALANRG